ncbi:MAG TPA: DciA family protein [Casimicrobiaceae bacterium]|nr:DciA family protein [Casimicrobiaceae bacterium]
MRPLRDILTTEPALAGSLHRHRREAALLARLRTLLPPALAAQVRVADGSRSDLLLAAATGAAATLIRHRGPEVLEKLAGEGWKFTGIQVRVQVRPTFTQRGKVYAKQLDREAAEAVRDGADRIADPDLAAALRRLAERGAGVSEDEQRSLQGVEDQHPKQKK